MKRGTILLLITCLLTITNSQTRDSIFNPSLPTIKLKPGPNYEAGGLHEFFFGKHWRDLWTAPIEVNIIDLRTLKGGLKATKTGGGLQTKSLRLEDKNGIEYKFRSVDKDPTKVLLLRNPELEGTVADDVLQDQISTANPYGPLLAYHLLRSAGIFQFKPELLYMPDDPDLGEYRKVFKNMLGFLEEVPDEKNVPGSDKVFGTVKLLDRLAEERDEYVDGKEFLKARLMDILMGDWDRHKDQWRWMRFKNPDETEVWLPYPQDRDQVFTKFDGIFPGIAETIMPQLNDFGTTYPDIKYLTWTGRDLDQRFLAFLDKKTWDSVTNFIYASVTDAEIENAISSLPELQYNIAHDELYTKLTSRRAQLLEASNEFYDHVNHYVDVYTTDKDDYVDINLKSTGTEVFVYKRGDEGEDDKLLRSKTFETRLTDEIRVYLLDEDDRVTIRGKDNGIRIRLIGGDGKDEFENKSDYEVYLYDSGKKTKVKGDFEWDDDFVPKNEDSIMVIYNKEIAKIKSKGLSADDEKKALMDLEEEYEDPIGNAKYDLRVIDKYHRGFAGTYLRYSQDFGAIVGLSGSWYYYSFRAQPYKAFHQVYFAYATRRRGFEGLIINYKGIYNDNFFKWLNINTELLKTGIEVNNFFGFGNETQFNEPLYQDKFYRVNFNTYRANILASYPRHKSFKVNLGIKYAHQKTELEDNSFINLTRPVGTETEYNLITPRLGFTLDKRDHADAPYKGVYFDVYGEVTPKLFDGAGPYQRVVGDARAYLFFDTFTPVSLAFRLKGEKLWGKFPFFESAFLGGINSLRGYPSERFAGDVSVYAGSELRFKLFNMDIIVPEELWLFGFAETGRVFLESEPDSKLWHPSYGAGLYFLVINRDITLGFTYAVSKEKKRNIYFNTGFTF